MLNWFNCLLSRHKVNRNRVWHDGLDFRSRCTVCKSELVRTDDRGWQALRQEHVADDRRLTKPSAKHQNAH